jgi:hypothetical protein
LCLQQRNGERKKKKGGEEFGYIFHICRVVLSCSLYEMWRTAVLDSEIYCG